MQSTPKSLRLHIGIFGRRNVGKSSLLNAITRQQVSIVSAHAGTTTDPVEKPMELLPLGPVLFVDTAGIDDEGALGELRMQRTRAVLDRVDIGIVVTEAGTWGRFEAELVEQLQTRRIPITIVANKIDVVDLSADERVTLGASGAVVVPMSARNGTGVAALREALLGLAPADFFDSRRVVADLVPAGAVAVLVVPIDKEAPKGRLILPQVMSIRDLLDGESLALVTQERELRHALASLTKPPALVVTDSQAFLKVAADVPADVPMTSFSILMARFQGDLPEQVRGALGIERLRAPSYRRRYRPREDPAVVDAVRRCAARVRSRAGARLPCGPHAVPDSGALWQLHRQSPRDALADSPVPRSRCAHHELRPDDCVFARDLRACARALPRRPGCIPCRQVLTTSGQLPCARGLSKPIRRPSTCCGPVQTRFAARAWEMMFTCEA